MGCYYYVVFGAPKTFLGHTLRREHLGVKDQQPITKATSPEGPSALYLGTLVPKTSKGMVFWTRVPKY